MNHPQLVQSAQRRRARRAIGTPEPARGTRLMLAWTPGLHDAAATLGPTQFELVGEFAAAAGTRWTRPGCVGSTWVDALSSARCREVVLTARLDDDVPGKHLVLELAEFLTFRLSESQPLIRVRFLPTTSAPRRSRSHA